MPVGLSSKGMGITVFTNSGAVSSSSATPNIGLAANAALYQAIPACEAIDLLLNVTANTGTGGANKAWVELQTSPDGGTTWFCAARFGQITQSSTFMRIAMRTNGIGANESAAQTVDINTATATVVQNCILSGDQRLVWTLATGQSLTFGVYAVVQQAGTRAAY